MEGGGTRDGSEEGDDRECKEASDAEGKEATLSEDEDETAPLSPKARPAAIAPPIGDDYNLGTTAGIWAPIALASEPRSKKKSQIQLKGDIRVI